MRDWSFSGRWSADGQFPCLVLATSLGALLRANRATPIAMQAKFAALSNRLDASLLSGAG
jgi:hypothetical protein